MPVVSSLVDVNKSIGFSSVHRPDFATARELLAHMDRLGIARSLVWHEVAKTASARWANELLLKELAATPGAAGRLIPALSVAPTMYHEARAMDELRQQMRRHAVRALRYPRLRGNWSMFELEPVLADLLSLRPTLLIDCRDGFAPQDVAEFAGRFPELPVVITTVMWGPQVNVFEVMRRCKNVLLDISWLHAYWAIETACERFGAERLVFGTNFRSDEGAAIASLMHASISNGQRELIAHGNVERLLGLPAAGGPGAAIAPADAPDGAGRAGPRRTGRLWSTLLSGRPLAAEVIDAHAHLGPLGSTFHEVDTRRQADQMVAWMDRLGVGMTILSAAQALFGHPIEGNLEIEEALRPYGERLRGYLVFNPVYAEELAPRLDELFSKPFFVGFKTLCDYWQTPITDERFRPMFEYANRHRLPILNHTWNGSCDAAGMFADIAPRYPEAAFLLGHSGGGDRRAAVQTALACPNVYLEWCGSFTVSDSWKESIARVGHERVLFGTDAIFHDPAWELGRLLSQDVPDEKLTPILGANMRAIMARRR